MRSERSITNPDYSLLILFFILIVFGIVMLASASAPLGYGGFGDKFFFVKRQIVYGLIPGLLVLFFILRMHPDTMKRIGPLVYLVSLVLLASVYIPNFGSTLGTGSRSWISFGSFSLQPSEFAKIGLILFFASLIDRHLKDITTFFSGFLPALIFGLVPVVFVVLQPDVGTASVLFGMLISLLYVAGAKLRHLLLLFVLGAVAFTALIVVAPYRTDRLKSFIHPELDPTGIGYQVNQAEIAVGSGGMFGLGYGHSRQKFEYLPEVHGDSIFAIIGEEMGFVFAVGLIIIYTIIAMRSLHIAKRIDDLYGRLIIAGVVSWFTIQTFLNIGGIVGILPLTGVPLPFISHGGTALLVVLAGAGLIVSVSRMRTR
jgi:cell division protein FtsW